MHGRAGHVTKSEVLLAEFSFNEIFFFFFFFIEREVLVRDGGGRLGGWGRPCHRWRMEIESGGRLTLGFPSLVG